MIHVLDDEKPMNGEIEAVTPKCYKIKWSNGERQLIKKSKFRDLTKGERKKGIFRRLFKKRYIMVNPL